MESNGWLVQHVEHPGEPRADLRGKADTLALAARQRAGGAGEREVIEADIVEEGEPLADLFQDALGDLVLLRRELRGQFLEPRSRLPDRHLGDLADMQPVDLDRERLRLQPVALARLAELIRLVARQLLRHPGRLGLAPAPLDIVDHALERLRGRVAAHAVVIGESDLVLARAVQHHVAELLGQILPRLGHELAIGAGQRFQRLLVIGRGSGCARPGRDGSACEAQTLVGHDQLGLEEQLGAEPVAFGAGAVRIVEGEEAGLDLLDGEARHGAGELRREDDALLVRAHAGLDLCIERDLLGMRLARAPGEGRRFRVGRGGAVGELGDGDALAQGERGLEAVGEPRARVRPHHHAVHHHVDVVLDLLVQRGHLGDLVELAVDLDPREALLLQIGEVFAVLALPPARDRREQIKPRAFGQRQHAVDHLAHRLAFDGEPGRGRIGNADPRPQQPHIVVDLGDGADRRARVLRGGLLLDGDGGRQPVDVVDVGLLHHVEELAGIGRQRLDIATLTLGIDGVEGERGLARARQPGDHHELFARQLDRDVLEIVLARAAD